MIKDFIKDKFIISFLSLLLVISFFGSPVFVSAAGTLIDSPVTSGFHSASNSGAVSEDLAKKIYNSFSKNPHLSDLGITGDFVIFIHKYDNSDLGSIQISGFDYCYSCGYSQVFSSSSTSIIYAFVSSTSISESNLSNFETMNFTVNSVSPVNGQYNGVIRNTAANNIFIVATVTYVNDSVTSPQYNRPYSGVFAFGSFDLQDYDLVNPFFSLDVDDFYTWLVNNDKIQISGDSGGVSVGGKIPSYIGLQKLKSFLTFYKNFGSSNQSFSRHIVDWFSFMNIVGQTKDNINVLKSTIDSLYQEYINYRSGTHAYWPTAQKIQKRQSIDTITDDDNITLITDDSSDTVDVSLLRDILRGVIAVSNNLNQGVSDIVASIDRLDFTVNVANNGGASLDFDANSIWGTGDITQSENYLALTNAFMDKGVDVSAAENMKINYLDTATQQNSFTVSVVMPDQFVNGQFTEKTVSHTIDNTSKMYNTLILFRKLIAFAVVGYFAIRIRFELPHLIRGE